MHDPLRSWSPLHTAAGAGNAGMVELLLAHGAKVASKDDYGDTPLDIALRSKHTKVESEPQKPLEARKARILFVGS